MDVFVKNFSLKTTKNDLEELFSVFGTVQSVKIMRDKYTNESKGFAFIDINFLNNAADTIKELNGKSYNGRVLTVKKAASKPVS